ncbi:family 43 glycosylhydrolase [Gaoshiqia sp. Z1-71]|uniref:family 43 glycosylhydrolase n=1 Tax=Gaoshiqia hydrogeniformans TaxID=3290090 RepID=UPI003BF81FAA
MKTFGLFGAILLLTLSMACQKSIRYSGNPILPDFHADPSARVFGNKLWIYPSHDIAGSIHWDMVDWHAFSSSDLVNWTDHGVIFGLDDIVWADKWAWAPDCIERDGKYYFYFPADDQIGVAVSDKPEGPFVDPLGKPLIEREESGTRVMDPTVFIDDDGQAYLYFGQNVLRVVKLKEDMITRDGDITELEAENFHEGIWMHKYNGKYYLSYPEWDGKNAGKLAYSIGDTPYGPFEYKGVIMDNNSRNIHHSIVQFKDEWYLFYHIQGPSAFERRVCAEFLEYNPDGTIKSVEMTERGIK